MRIVTAPAAPVILLFWVSFMLFAPALSADGRMLLLSEYAQEREMQDRAAAEIARLDGEIAKNEASIGRTQKIIALARQRSDPEARQAEAVARQAWEKAVAAQRVNELARKKWQFTKARSDAAAAAIRGLLEQGADAASGVRGMLTERSGKVSVTKADGREAGVTEVFLEKGDRLRVEDGRAELKVLDGRGVAVAGPGTEIVLAEDSSAEQILDQLGGKIHVSVEKTGEFTRRMSAWLMEFEKNVSSIAGGNWAKIDHKVLESNLPRQMKLIYLMARGKETRRHMPTVAIGVRGTQFVSEACWDGSLVVTVLEGVVEISVPELELTVSVSGGEQAIIDQGGAIRRERPGRIDAWWEDPEA